jgi:hypothetical protein
MTDPIIASFQGARILRKKIHTDYLHHVGRYF